MSAADALHFRRRLLVWGALLSVVEVAAVGAPLVTFFQLDAHQRALAWAAAPTALAIGWGLWWALMRLWSAPLDRAVRRHRAGEALDRDAAEAVYRATLVLPRRVALLRAVLWGAATTAVCGLLVVFAAFPVEGLITVVTTTLMHAMVVEVLRAIAWSRVLGRLRSALLTDVNPLRLFRDGYERRLVREAMATSALGVVGFAAFWAVFLPINLEHYVRLETWFPLTVLGLVVAWQLVVHRMARPIDRYLEAATSPSAKEQPVRDDPRAIAAYRAAQALPYKLAAATVVLWLLGEILLVVEGTLLFHIDVETGGLMAGAAFIVSIGVVIYEALWHRRTMRPLLAHLATRHRPRLEGSGATLSRKMIGSFAGLTAFACGLSLLLSFVQYKTLVTRFIQRETELRLERILSDIRATSARAGKPLPEGEVERALAAEARDATVIYYLPPSDGARVIGFGGGKAGTPPLPWTGEALLHRLERGQMELAEQHLSGAFARVYDERHTDLGAIAVLSPNYRGRGVSIDRPIQILVFFFAMLVGISMGIVFLVVADVTAPIRLLEKRADAMARSDLSPPREPIAVESDEVGRLTYAFEEMRRELFNMLRSSTETNISLEKDLQRRNQELERRNQELKDALDTQQRLQAELIRSEKMASMGRLVAGIAHEINNPVSAVSAIIRPLKSTLDEALARLDGLPTDERQEITSDVGRMMEIVQNGMTRTKRIVEALHTYSRGDNERLVDVDLHRGIDISLDLLRHELKQGITVERAYGDVGRVRGYGSQLDEVFMNLLTNAAQALVEQHDKAQARGETLPPGKITIATHRDGNKVVVTVADNGPGIPPDKLPKIFDPFFTTKEPGKGSGLGLSIVHGIVDRHGGTIAVDSEVGKGTTFTVTLRAAPEVVH